VAGNHIVETGEEISTKVPDQLLLQGISQAEPCSPFISRAGSIMAPAFKIDITVMM